MFGGILSKILGGALVVTLIAGGILYVQNLRLTNQVQLAEGRAQVAESNLKTAEKTIAILKEYEDVDTAIEESPDDDVAYYLSHGVWRDSNTKGNRVPAPAPAPGAKEPGARQK